MKLHFNPLHVFKSGKTPACLYARKKWLAESGTRHWKNDFQETVSSLLTDQGSDGSWNQSEVATITRLFGLHLTVRETSAKIEAALNWLVGKIDLLSAEFKPGADVGMIQETLQGLPFVSSRRDTFLVGAVLFLASIFDRWNDPVVIKGYRLVSSLGIRKKGRWIDPASWHNIFRALVVHPHYSKDKATSLFVQYLSEKQTESGDWGEGLPFHQTLNALAHLGGPQVDEQLDKAFLRLTKTQNANGTWGETESEWNTFLAVHALKNKGLF